MMFSCIGDRVGKGLSQISSEVVEHRSFGHVNIKNVQDEFFKYDLFYDPGFSFREILEYETVTDAGRSRYFPGGDIAIPFRFDQGRGRIDDAGYFCILISRP